MRAALIKYRAWGGFALLLAVAAAAWMGGQRAAEQNHQAETAALKAKYAQEKLDAEQRHTAALQAALVQQQQWQQFAQKQGAELAQIRVRLDKQTELLSKDINHAIEQDKNSGHDCVGIGTHSLHLYNRAFGYRD